MKINKKIIEELVGYLKEFNLSEIEYSEGSTKAKVSRSVNSSNVISSDEKKKSIIKKIDESDSYVSSPLVGTVYLAPEPGGKTFVEIGQKIKKGQTIVIIEAMKTMNHVPASLDGVVKKILVKDGEPVEFGQPLITIK
mgnify:CR=1 FL=1